MDQGNYDPHFITGLGSLLWGVDSYWSKSEIALTAINQYVDYISDINLTG